MRKETKLNLPVPELDVVAGPSIPLEQTKVRKPAIQQTFGEIAGALKGLIPGLEADAKLTQETEFDQAKQIAAGMTVQEAISFAAKSGKEQAKVLKTTGLKATAAAQAAIGKKIAASMEFSKEAYDALYDPTKSDTERKITIATEQHRLLGGLANANPIIRSAATEQVLNYTRQVVANTSSIRKQRIDNIAVTETYDDTHEKVTNFLEGYTYDGNSELTVSSIKKIDKTLRDNFAGIPGVNKAFDDGVKDALLGFADQHPDDANKILEDLVEKKYFNREQATELQDKIQSQQDIRQRRTDRADNVKFNELGETADKLILGNLKEGIEPGTSVTGYLKSEKGLSLVSALTLKAQDLGIDINSGRFASLIRQTATNVFRDAGAGEYDIGKDKEKEVRDVGANEKEFNDLVISSDLSPEQTARANQIFGQSKKQFQIKVDQLEVDSGMSPKFLSQEDQQKYSSALKGGDLEAVQELIRKGNSIWQYAPNVYKEIIDPSIKQSYTENIAFNGSSGLSSSLTKATGQTLEELDITDDDLRKEAERIIEQRVKNIPNWFSLTVEQKARAIDSVSKLPLRMSETSYDDVIKAKDTIFIPAPDVDNSNIPLEKFQSTIEFERQNGDKFLKNIEDNISDRDLNEFLSDLDNKRFVLVEKQDTLKAYTEVQKGGASEELKQALAFPLISIGTSLEEVSNGVLYTGKDLVLNSTSFTVRFRDPKTGAVSNKQETVQPLGGLGIEKIIPKIEGTKLYDMSYLAIRDKSYESDLDEYLKMSKGDASESKIGQFLTIVGPKDLPDDPKDKAVIQYIQYLKDANKLALSRASKNTRKALLINSYQ